MLRPNYVTIVNPLGGNHGHGSIAVKGNVVDMAVGAIIGAAFEKIVSSLVTDVVMPL